MLGKANRKICNSEYTKICFWVMVVVIVLCLFSYGYFVRGAIVNIVQRQNMENSILSHSSIVLQLESEYMKTKNSVNLEKAQELGFVSVSSKKFVNRGVDNISLSLLTEGI